MAAYASGDRHGFDALFASVGPRVHAFFLRSMGSRATADDLTQITFLKLHRARAGYRRGSPFRPWLFTIAARVRLDELRKRYRLAEDADEEAIARADEERAVAEAAMQRGSTDDLCATVRAALGSLPEHERVVIHLHRFEEMSFAQVATVLGSTEGAVKLRAFRAYAKLRLLLRDLVAKENTP